MKARYLDEVRRGLQRAPDEIAVVCDSRTLTQRQVQSWVHRLARALYSRGLHGGAGIACLIGDTAEALLIRLAANFLGCRFTGLTPYFGISTTKSVLADSAPAALVFDPVLNRYATELLRGTDIANVLTLGPSRIGEDLLALAERQPDDPLPNTVEEHDVAQVSYTSGTTGRPKGVANSFDQLANFLAASRAVFGTGPRRLLVTNPLAYLGGDMAIWTLAEGGTVVLHDSSAPTAAILADIEAHKVSHLHVSPSQLYRLSAAAAGHDLSSVRRIVYGGAAAVSKRTSEALERFGPVLYQTYALRETGFITGLDPDAHRRPELLDSIGWPLPGVDVAIRDQQGRPLPPGEIGEITVRSDSVMTGYWNAPDLSAAALREGWLHTGDLGRQNPQGWLHLVDRIKDVVLIDGFTVHSRPVEDVLNSHPLVRQAVVVAVPDDITGEAVHTAIVPQPDTELSIDELQDFVGARLGGTCVPTSIDFVDEIPLTAAGKPDKKALRARHAAHDHDFNV
jgi:fatty-acyl-CoA synthase